MSSHATSRRPGRSIERMPTRWLAMIGCIAFLGAYTVRTHAQEASPQTIRIATYNASLYGKESGQILERLKTDEDRQANNVARIVQTIRPDVMLINEIDYDKSGAVAKALNENYFAKPHEDLQPHSFSYVYSVPSNTGIDSGLDLNNNDKTGEPNDAWGFGVYPGQYSMAVFSRFPIDAEQIRSFRRFLWKDLPGALRPTDPKTKTSYYDDETWNQLRLSSKNHIDVPIQVGGTTIHVLACHPTPPVFDGAEDRNGCRNHDEIKFWSEYLKGSSATTLTDDQGNSGGLKAGESFVIMGDLNSDSVDGDSRQSAIVNLLKDARAYDPLPKSKGALSDGNKRKAAAKHKGDHALDTAAFGGNMRVDYVIPSKTLKLKNSGVVWPEKGADNFDMIRASDHRMVWVEVNLPSK